jgi:TonB family protein
MKLTVILGIIFVFLIPAGVANAQSSKPTESPELVESREITSVVLKLFSAGQYEQALPLAKQALELRVHALGSQDQDLIPLLINLAEINTSLKRFEDSESFFNRALKIAETAYGGDSIKIAAILDRLAHVAHELGRDAIVEKVLIRSLNIKEKVLNSNDLEIAQAVYNLARLYQVRGDYKKAAPLYNRAVQIRENAREKDHTNLIRALAGYFLVLTALKRTEEASQVQHRIAELSADSAIVQNGGVLNGKALFLPAPSYPLGARQDHAAGMVYVKVLIDENGNVISAEAFGKAHPALVSAAEKAARKARFSPTFVSGVPIRVTGTIIYNFVAQ